MPVPRRRESMISMLIFCRRIHWVSGEPSADRPGTWPGEVGSTQSRNLPHASYSTEHLRYGQPGIELYPQTSIFPVPDQIADW